MWREGCFMKLFASILFSLFFCGSSIAENQFSETHSFANESFSSLSSIRAVIFDMDGVFRRGFDAIDFSDSLIKWMEENSINGMILTNECRYTPSQLRKDLHHMNIPYPDSWDIYTSALAARDFFQDHLIESKPIFVYVVGEGGLKKALNQVNRESFFVMEELPEDNKLKKCSLYVVFGSVDRIKIWDLENATKWINAGAKVIMTCPDISDPSSKGSSLIGMPNHLVHMIKMCAPCAPYSIGKPHPFMIKKALQLLREKDPTLQDKEILFVGDSLDTDIRAAFETGIPSALVLSGNTRLEGVSYHAIEANFIFPSVKEILDAFISSKGELGLEHVKSHSRSP